MTILTSRQARAENEVHGADPFPGSGFPWLAGVVRLPAYGIEP
ncbi:hypothetical protein PUR61_44275 [Streptomyces sp. BE20]|nr:MULTISPECIES: hypothetical protein [unclassified Streptomyces]MED7953131.1 hypothetical protein [Streptomyces sp. BE303]MEE1829136.1 hypothetical protein [Streptomyces sp. BE20]